MNIRLIATMCFLVWGLCFKLEDKKDTYSLIQNLLTIKEIKGRLHKQRRPFQLLNLVTYFDTIGYSH